MVRKFCKKCLMLMLMAAVCVGCQWQLKAASQQADGQQVSIQRYDRIEALYLTTGDYSAMQQLNTYFPTETRMLIEDVLKLGHVDDTSINTRFLYFFQDSTLQRMLSDVQQQYSNMDDLNEQLSEAFERMRKQLPDMDLPQVYAQIGSFDQSIVVSGGSLGVSLDKYLGSDYPFYVSHYSEEQRRLMTRDMIVPDCLAFYILSHYPLPAKSQQSDRDEHMGRIQWVVNQLTQRRVFASRHVDAVRQYMERHPGLPYDSLLQQIAM